MTADRSAYFKEYREKRRGAPARTPEPCGTWAAVMRHYRAGESLAHGSTVCQKCTDYRDEHNADMYRKRKEKKG